jgi:hypothetical protein
MGATCCNVPITSYYARYGPRGACGSETGYMCKVCGRVRIPFSDTPELYFGSAYRKEVNKMRQRLAAEGVIKWSEV